ncbi:hypothetical protein LCL99_02210 [Halomonas denitrificans]|uniref:hypothetical protein n=1 Tax=Halomonas TaxID=2745 RepID=UPI001A8CA3BD|nr:MULTISPECIES: hypothetical protein [Halomonas]MBN8414372.1 hypothetical protein [Halomonas litopenaei]MBY6029853.1 hypothetical protein [Halomonas sp. DP8Y7-1]MCA0973278.1 hypothetical protein [Halomonas denitrificans]
MKKPSDDDPCQCSPKVALGQGKAQELVVAKVPQGFDTNISIRLVPGQDFALPRRPLRCRPRKGAPRRDAEPLALPDEVMEMLQKADQAVIEWLSQSEANALLYMARPAEALLKAGIKLSRQQLKSIHRVHREVEQAAVIGPGVKVAGFKIATFPRGRVGQISPDEMPKDDDGDAQREEG